MKKEKAINDMAVKLFQEIRNLLNLPTVIHFTTKRWYKVSIKVEGIDFGTFAFKVNDVRFILGKESGVFAFPKIKKAIQKFANAIQKEEKELQKEIFPVIIALPDDKPAKAKKNPMKEEVAELKNKAKAKKKGYWIPRAAVDSTHPMPKKKSVPKKKKSVVKACNYKSVLRGKK